MAAARAKKKRDPHPEEELRDLSAALKSGDPARGYVLRGEERYFRDRASKLITQQALLHGQELCRHDAKDPEFSLSRLLDDLTGGALFATARCIHVENVGGLLKKGGKQYAPAFITAATARLTSTEPGTLVIAGDAIRADNPLAKRVKEGGGTIIACRRLWDSPPPWDPDPRKAELAQWVLARAREEKVSLDASEAAYVAAATGNDLYALETQLRTLKSRGEKGVRELVGWESGGSPFELAGHIVAGDAARSVAGLEALFKSGFHGRDGTRTIDRGGLVSMLVGAISGKAKECVRGRAALEEGESMERAATLAGVGGGPMARKAFEARVRLRSADEWRAVQADVAEVERRTRSGAVVDANDFAWLALRWRKRRGR